MTIAAPEADEITEPHPTRSAGRLELVVPPLFVLLWASGFVVARLVRPYAEPESFVAVRFAFSVAVLSAIAVAGGARWPRTLRGWRNGLIAGALMQGVYVGGVFWAIKHGLPAAVAALISGLQPLLTGMLAGPLLGERVSRRRWLGIAIGFAGALLVLEPSLRGTGAVPPTAVIACLVATLGITLGTLWQKRFGIDSDLRTSAAVQFIGGFILVLPLAIVTERHPFIIDADLFIGLAWSVLVLSVAAALLLLRLIRGGAVAKVTSLFYLVPPFTALMAFALFGEELVAVQILGMAVAAGGVALANRG